MWVLPCVFAFQGTLQGEFCDSSKNNTGGGFEYVFIFTPTWEDDPIWIIFFKRVETTN